MHFTSHGAPLLEQCVRARFRAVHRTIFTQHADCQTTVENASRHAWTLAIHNHKHIDENIKEVDVLRPAKDAAFLVLISKSSETLASMANVAKRFVKFAPKHDFRQCWLREHVAFGVNDVRAIERLRRIDFMGDVKSLTDDDVGTIKLVAAHARRLESVDLQGVDRGVTVDLIDFLLRQRSMLAVCFTADAALERDVRNRVGAVVFNEKCIVRTSLADCRSVEEKNTFAQYTAFAELSRRSMSDALLACPSVISWRWTPPPSFVASNNNDNALDISITDDADDAISEEDLFETQTDRGDDSTSDCDD